MKKRNHKGLYRGLLRVIVSIAVMGLWTTFAYAEVDQTNAEETAQINVEETARTNAKETAHINTEEVVDALLLILILAVLLETGLSTLFNWRIYLRYFDGVGIKVPIAVISAWLIVDRFEVDVIKMIFDASMSEGGVSSGGKFLTALVIAGGSSTVFTIFTKLGLQNPLERKGVAENMRKERRLKVELARIDNNNPVSILVNDEMIGIINPEKRKFGGVYGYPIAVGEQKIVLKSQKKTGEEMCVEKETAIAPGATVIETFQLTSDELKTLTP